MLFERILIYTFQFILLFSMYFCGSFQYRKLIKVNQGTGLDYHKLWDLTGYTCEEDADGNLRSGSIDRPNDDRCLYAYHVNFRPTDTTIRQYPVNASLYSWLNKGPFLATYDSNGKTVSVNANTNPRMYLHDITDGTKFYMSIWYSIGSFSPRMFTVSTRRSVSVRETASYVAGTGLVPNHLVEDTFVQVYGKYHDYCTPDEPERTVHLSMAECYRLIACPLTQLERQNSRFKEGFFTVSDKHSGHLPSSHIVWVKTDQGLLSCEAICRQTVNCMSYFYAASNLTCYGYKHPVSWTDSPKNYLGLKHYVNQYCDI